MKYYDVLYGSVILDDIVAEVLDRCWEVRRLKDVGLMNFRSISMLSLTRCSRLEHAFGTAYLAQRYAERNGLDQKARRTLVAAALLHDVSCAPFGHSVEWALMASGRAESHETAGQWLTRPRLSASRSGRPAFLDSEAFEPVKFGLNVELFRCLQEGRPGHTELASSYMDLDNIDNVFRMAHYLGFEGAGRESVVRLVDALRLQPGDSHFTVSEDVVPDAMLWQRLRHDVYKTFIYDAAYLSFECQIFEFIAGLLARVSDPTEIEALGEFPDDVLLWEYFADPSYSEMRPLIRRLIACESYECLYIGRIENAALCKSLPSAEEIRNLRNQFVSDVVGALKSTTTLVNEPVLARWLKGMKSNQLEISPPMHFHVTTDKRKTGREILLSVGASPEQARSLRIGDDRYFVVCALFTETALNEREQKFVKECFEESIARWAGERPETIYVMSPARRQLQLPI